MAAIDGCSAADDKIRLKKISATKSAPELLLLRHRSLPYGGATPSPPLLLSPSISPRDQSTSPRSCCCHGDDVRRSRSLDDKLKFTAKSPSEQQQLAAKKHGAKIIHDSDESVFARDAEFVANLAALTTEFSSAKRRLNDTNRYMDRVGTRLKRLLDQLSLSPINPDQKSSSVEDDIAPVPQHVHKSGSRKSLTPCLVATHQQDSIEGGDDANNAEDVCPTPSSSPRLPLSPSPTTPECGSKS